MKKFLALFTALTSISTLHVALAQSSSVTLYGIIDTMIRHTNNEVNTATGERGSKTKLEQGVYQGPRLGFKGVEDLGGGTSALFQLEMGFQSDTGESDQQGQLFGRQAFVGLKNNTWGEIDVGRQYGIAFDVLGNFDPLGMGNTPENAWQLFLIGVRFDNTIKYTNSWGPISTELQYSFGEQAGATSIGSTYGGALTYDDNTFSAAIFNQRSKDANANFANIAGVGTSLDLAKFVFYLNYINARRDPGFGIAASNSGGPLANTSMMGNFNSTLTRTDNVATAGVIYQATPKLAYTLGYMTDWVKNDTDAGNSGRLSTLYAIADYSLSARTDVYLNLDYTRIAGGEIDNGALTNTVLQFVGAGMGGATNRTGIAVGLRTKF